MATDGHFGFWLVPNSAAIFARVMGAHLFLSISKSSNQVSNLTMLSLVTGPPDITQLTVQGGSQSHPSGCTLEVGRGQRHTADAVPDHCSFQAWLQMYCVWHSFQYQFTTTWQYPQRWAKTGTRGILHQPSLQYVHGGQRISFGGTSVEVVHELLPENSCLH